MPQEFPRATAAEMAGQTISLHTGQSADELALLLPPKARQRLEILTLRREDSHRLIPEGDMVRAVNAERFAAERALQKMLDPPPAGHLLHPDDLRVVVAQRNLSKLERESASLQERYQVRAQAFQAIARVHEDAMAWITHGRPSGTVLEDYSGPEPKLSKGEDIPTAISRLQRRGRELKADLARISAAPFPSAHAKVKMRQEIETLAQRGAPSMALLIEHDREIVWPQTNLRAAIYNATQPSFAASETTDVLALFAWLHRDHLIKRFEADIDAESDDAVRLTHAARQQQSAQVASDLLAVERDEAHWTFAGWEAGLPIAPRPDIASTALLNVEIITPPAINGRCGSSPERSGLDLFSGGRQR